MKPVPDQGSLFRERHRLAAGRDVLRTEYLPYARGSRTSRAAAENKRRAGTEPTDRERVLAFLRECGMGGATDNEIIAAMKTRHGMKENTPRARRVGLVQDGLTLDSGEKRDGCTVWRAAPALGRQAPEDLRRGRGVTLEERRQGRDGVGPPMKIYVASSWRNQIQPEVVRFLRDRGYEVYDFKNPAHGDSGFHWSEIDPHWKNWTTAEFRQGLGHHVAQEGFRKDMAALEACDLCVLVLPCGRSAHLELGWAVGAGKRSIVFMQGPAEPELMYRMVDNVVDSFAELGLRVAQLGNAA